MKIQYILIPSYHLSTSFFMGQFQDSIFLLVQSLDIFITLLLLLCNLPFSCEFVIILNFYFLTLSILVSSKFMLCIIFVVLHNSTIYIKALPLTYFNFPHHTLLQLLSSLMKFYSKPAKYQSKIQQ